MGGDTNTPLWLSTLPPYMVRRRLGDFAHYTPKLRVNLDRGTQGARPAITWLPQHFLIVYCLQKTIQHVYTSWSSYYWAHYNQNSKASRARKRAKPPPKTLIFRPTLPQLSHNLIPTTDTLLKTPNSKGDSIQLFQPFKRSLKSPVTPKLGDTELQEYPQNQQTRDAKPTSKQRVFIHTFSLNSHHTSFYSFYCIVFLFISTLFNTFHLHHHINQKPWSIERYNNWFIHNTTTTI